MAPTPDLKMSTNAADAIFRKMQMHLIHILPDAKVSLEITPLRPTKGRVKDRHK